jgi:hypothetical protein
MMPANMKSQTLLGKIKTAVRNDPKKAAILTVLVAILVVLQVRLQMSKSDTSSRATAAMLTPGGATHNDGSSSEFGTGGSASSARPQDAAGALRAWMNAPPTPIGRNLFAINLEKFPQDQNHFTNTSSGVSGFWDELAKSMSSRADVRKERQILMENLTQQASQLRLQSTMMGAVPKAVVDGGMVGEGDVVACGSGETRTTFRVLRIEPRRIIVEREGIKLEIQMK